MDMARHGVSFNCAIILRPRRLGRLKRASISAVNGIFRGAFDHSAIVRRLRST